MLILIVVTLSVSGVLGWYLLGGQSPKEPGNQGAGALLDARAPGSNEGAGNDTITRRATALSSVAAVSAANAPTKERIRYYEKGSGRVVEIGLDGRREQIISDKKLPNFIETLWSPNKNEVISSFYSPSGTRFSYYNYSADKTVALESSIKDVAFSPDGSEIAYFKTDGQQGAVYRARPDGSSPRKVFATRIGAAELSWPMKESFALIVREEATGLSSLVLLSTDGERLTTLLAGLSGLEVAWSRSGTHAFFSFFDDESRLHSGTVAVATNERREFSASTRASKCAWSADEKTLYCGVSQSPVSAESVNAQSFLPDDILAFSTVDDSQTMLLAGNSRSNALGVSYLFLSPGEEYLIFVNTLDGKLYALKK